MDTRRDARFSEGMVTFVRPFGTLKQGMAPCHGVALITEPAVVRRPFADALQVGATQPVSDTNLGCNPHDPVMGLIKLAFLRGRGRIAADPRGPARNFLRSAEYRCVMRVFSYATVVWGAILSLRVERHPGRRECRPVRCQGLQSDLSPRCSLQSLPRLEEGGQIPRFGVLVLGQGRSAVPVQ